jgi:hypothetical protein
MALRPLCIGFIRRAKVSVTRGIEQRYTYFFLILKDNPRAQEVMRKSEVLSP